MNTKIKSDADEISRYASLLALGRHRHGYFRIGWVEEALRPGSLAGFPLRVYEGTKVVGPICCKEGFSGSSRRAVRIYILSLRYWF
jgi:hypothetical protein